MSYDELIAFHLCEAVNRSFSYSTALQASELLLLFAVSFMKRFPVSKSFVLLSCVFFATFKSLCMPKKLTWYRAGIGSYYLSTPTLTQVSFSD